MALPPPSLRSQEELGGPGAPQESGWLRGVFFRISEKGPWVSLLFGFYFLSI